MANEKLLESKLRRDVKKMGGMAIKFVSPGHAGVSDRIVIMPGGLIWFVELKSEGKKLSPLQKIFKRQMEDLKCRYWLVDCPEMLAECLHEIEYITKIKNSK